MYAIMRESLGARTCTTGETGPVSDKVACLEAFLNDQQSPCTDTVGGNKELRRCIECFQVPVFRPIEAEWCDPLGYLASIRRQGELIGMAKIVPPSRWEAPLIRLE